MSYQWTWFYVYLLVDYKWIIFVPFIISYWSNSKFMIKIYLFAIGTASKLSQRHLVFYYWAWNPVSISSYGLKWSKKVHSSISFVNYMLNHLWIFYCHFYVHTKLTLNGKVWLYIWNHANTRNIIMYHQLYSLMLQ